LGRLSFSPLAFGFWAGEALEPRKFIQDDEDELVQGD
jgi:hypothetical protein